MPAEGDPAMDGRDGSPQQFCLRWNNYKNNLTSSFDQLLQTQSFVDVTLACDGQSIKAHKVVLSACSPYFEHLLMENPCQHPIIIIKDINFGDLRAAVDFMYRGEINVAQDRIASLLKVADTLRIRGLTDVSNEYAAMSDERSSGGTSRGRKRSASPAAAGSPCVTRTCRRTSPLNSGSGAAADGSPPRSEPTTPVPDVPPPAPSTPHHEDIDIRPGIAEMIREEERARMLENSQAWMGASTSSSGLSAETYQYRMQSLWQQCWSTNQNMVHNLRLRERGPLKSWRPETMAEAIFSVLKEGLSLSQAARKYDIPYPTFVLYANRVHNMLGPSADGGADLRPKGRGRPQRILLGSWPDNHIRDVIRAVVFRENHAAPPAPQHLRELELPIYPAITDGTNAGTSGGNGCGGEGHVSPNAAAAAAVAAVAQNLRRTMAAAQRPADYGGHINLPSLPLHSPRLASPLTAGLESPLCSPPPPPGHEPARPADPFRPFAEPPPERHAPAPPMEMGPPETPVSRNKGQGASPLEAGSPPLI